MTATSARVLIVLPYDMMARNIIHSGVLERVRERGVSEVLVVTPNAADAVHVERSGMRWTALFHPLRWNDEARPPSALRRRWWYLRYLAGTLWRMALVYRFNAMQGFRGFALRLRQSRRLRMKFIAEGLPMSRLFGLPFARSPRLYAWLYRAYYGSWQRFEPVDALFAQFRPTLMVLAHLQTPVVTPYVIAARSAGVPILGINGSWDQPTTKGPLCPGLARVLVQNEQVRDELSRHHGVPAASMATVGWPQMDPYAVAGTFLERGEFLRRSGYAEAERYLVFAANPGRLSHGEPEVATWLAEALRKRSFGRTDLRLHLRCHPNDQCWKERFGALADHPAVRIEPPRKAELAQLANLIRHAEVVIASAGSINLDAVALDTPTIGLAWEDESQPYWDRQARGYELEHLALVAQGEGLPLARNFEDLERLLREALGERARRAEGRRLLRSRFIDPLDGSSSARIADQIVAMLRGA